MVHGSDRAVRQLLDRQAGQGRHQDRLARYLAQLDPQGRRRPAGKQAAGRPVRTGDATRPATIGDRAVMPHEAVALCRFTSACCPAQKFDEYTPDAWGLILADVRFEDAKAAVVEIKKNSTWVDPS